MKKIILLFAIFFGGCSTTYTFKYAANYNVHPVSHKGKIQNEEIFETPTKIKIYKDSVIINNVLYDVYWRKRWMNGIEEIGLGGEQKIFLFTNPSRYKVGLLYKTKTEYLRLTERLDDI